MREVEWANHGNRNQHNGRTICCSARTDFRWPLDAQRAAILRSFFFHILKSAVGEWLSHEFAAFKVAWVDGALGTLIAGNLVYTGC